MPSRGEGTLVLCSRRRSTRGPLGLCTRSSQICMLALTVGEERMTSMFQVVLLLARELIAHLDMPLPCGLPEDKAASQLPPGNDRCCWRSFVPQILGQLRVYLCPSTVAGIHNKKRLVGGCDSSRELSLTLRKVSDLSLCKFHFKLFGALIVIPTLSTWLG